MFSSFIINSVSYKNVLNKYSLLRKLNYNGRSGHIWLRLYNVLYTEFLES